MCEFFVGYLKVNNRLFGTHTHACEIITLTKTSLHTKNYGMP
jgi:hypothetical protein